MTADSRARGGGLTEGKMRRKKEQTRHLHDKSPPDDVVQRPVVKSVFGFVVKILLVRADCLQQLQYVV